MSPIAVCRTALPIVGFEALAAEARDGRNRFAAAGEMLFGAFDDRTDCACNVLHYA